MFKKNSCDKLMRPGNTIIIKHLASRMSMHMSWWEGASTEDVKFLLYNE